MTKKLNPLKNASKHGIRIKHICSTDSLISILRIKQFNPPYKSPLAGDSGINCFIEGRQYQTGQCFSGHGACLIFYWEGPVKEVSIDEPFPLSPNILYNQENWRAIIPAGTNRKNIIVVGFDSPTENLSLLSKLILLCYRIKLRRRPITVELSSLP